MKMLNLNIINAFGLITLLTALSCSSGKDIYRNPYQDSNVKSSSSSSRNTIIKEASKEQSPEWIYAISKDFLVGYGQGKDVMEAQNSALNGIKKFIINSLGETGTIIEVNFVQNNLENRNSPQSNELYYLKQTFENKFHPVINISIERFEDYYWEKTGSSASYYIKYAITESELKNIKDEFHQKLAKAELLSFNIHQTIDSLCSFQKDFSVESLVSRHNSLSRILFTSSLNEKDSLYLVSGMANIRNLINSIEIRILDQSNEGTVLFALYCGGKIIRSSTKPVISSGSILVESLKCLNNIWELRFKVNPILVKSSQFEISLDLPQKRVSAVIPIKPIVVKPDFETINNVLISEFQKDNWNGKIKSMKIRIYIKSNLDKVCQLSSLGIILQSNGTLLPKILIEKLSIDVKPGINILEQTIKSDLPIRYFLSREMSADLSLYYTKGNNFKVIQLKSVTVTINN